MPHPPVGPRGCASQFEGHALAIVQYFPRLFGFVWSFRRVEVRLRVGLFLRSWMLEAGRHPRSFAKRSEHRSAIPRGGFVSTQPKRKILYSQGLGGFV